MPMVEGCKIINGEVWIQENRIVHVGVLSELEKHKKEMEYHILWDKEINIQGNLLMPGFKNAHTHSGMTCLRSYGDNLPLYEWLTKYIFPVENQLNRDDIYYATILAIMEYLSSGITCNFDMYLTPDTIAKASEVTKFRTVQTGAIHDCSQTIEDLEQWFCTYNQPDSLQSFRLGFHAEYTCSIHLLDQISDLCHKYKAPVYMHNSETEQEVKDCCSRYGKSPTQLFNELGLFDYGGGGFHCTHLSERDFEIFKEKDLSLITCPASNAKLLSGTAPIATALNYGINVALGTDGPASNNSLDMFREMYLLSIMSSIRENKVGILSPQDIISMATLGGAKALGLSQCAALSVGSLADIIEIDLSNPCMQPEHRIIDHLVYAGSKSIVKRTIVNGKILYEENAYHFDFDTQEIYDKVNAIVKEKMKY